MVKTGESRSSKYSAKQDPFVIMLRIKALQNSMKDKFQIPAVQATYVDENVQKWALDMGLTFGKTAVLLDLTKRYVWRLLKMNDLEIEAMHQQFLLKDFSEEQYVIWLDNLYAKNSEIFSLYSFCKRETAKIFSQVTYSEPRNIRPKLDISVEYGV